MFGSSWLFPTDFYTVKLTPFEDEIAADDMEQNSNDNDLFLDAQWRYFSQILKTIWNLRQSRFPYGGEFIYVYRRCVLLFFFISLSLKCRFCRWKGTLKNCICMRHTKLYDIGWTQWTRSKKVIDLCEIFLALYYYYVVLNCWFTNAGKAGLNIPSSFRDF